MSSEQVSRRGVVKALLGAGVSGVACAIAPALAADGHVRSGSHGSGGAALPVLRPADDWTRVLRQTPQLQLEPGATYVLERTVELPDGCVIEGNGATVTVAGDAIGAFGISGRRDVRIRNLVLLGRAQDPIGSTAAFGHVALRIARSSNVRVENCDFSHWRGAGIVLTGSVDDDYFDYRNKIVGNAFHHCYFGVSIADRAEFGQLLGNSFSSCRLAIWNSAGNWTIADNVSVGCHGAYYAIAQTSPYGELAADNWCHGTLVGNTFNHCNAGVGSLHGGNVRGEKPSARGQIFDDSPVHSFGYGPGNGGNMDRAEGFAARTASAAQAPGHYWSANAAFPVGGALRDPGRGVVVEGVLPPTFTGNTLWYSDVHARDLLGTRWLLSGCVLSNLTVTCQGSVPVELAGTQANGADSLPRRVGNVKLLF